MRRIRASSAGSDSRSSSSASIDARSAMSAGRSGNAARALRNTDCAAGVAVLDVEHRVVARLLDHLGEVEIEHGVVLAVEHHEAHGVAADLIHHFAQRDELACPLRHFHRLAGAQQPDELHDLDVEFGLAAAHRRDRRLHALDVAAVIGAPDVDQVAEAAVELRCVIGDVGGEIGVAAVRFLQRPVDIVAERGRAEQRLLAILPVLDRRAFRRRQPAFVDLAALAQPVDRRGDLVDLPPSISERSEKNTS